MEVCYTSFQALSLAQLLMENQDQQRKVHFLPIECGFIFHHSMFDVDFMNKLDEDLELKLVERILKVLL